MNKNYIKTFIFISSFFLLLTIFYPFILSIFFNNNNDKGTFGDSFGALNSFFSSIALCGVIVSIIMQQKEMNLQREEMISSRYEYIHNRVTNLVYLQLSKFEKIIDNIYLEKLFDKPSGVNAIYFLENNLTIINKYETEPEKIRKEALNQIQEIRKNYDYIYKCSSEISTFVISANNCSKALNTILNSSQLHESDNDELKRIFKENIGESIIDVLEKIENTIYYITLFQKDFTLSYNKDISAINYYIAELKENLR